MSKAAQKVRILSDLKSSNLISLGQLTDDGCEIKMNETSLDVTKNGNTILQGNRNSTDSLYDIPIYSPHPNPKTYLHTNNYVMPPIHTIQHPSPSEKTSKVRLQKVLPHKKLRKNPFHINNISSNCLDSLLKEQTTKNKQQKVNVILRKQQNSSDLAGFLHGCCGSPVPSTFIQGIKNDQFLTWPGLTAQLINKHLPPVKATVFGHMHQEKQHLQSTKNHTSDYITNIRRNLQKLKNIDSKKDIKTLLMDDIAKDAFPPSPTPNTKSNQVIYTLLRSEPKNIGYIDLTGKFPFRSAKGNQYILVAYHTDANAIYGQALKNRESLSIVNAWEIINKKFENAAVTPETYVIDNEASLDLTQAMNAKNIKFQLVPPHNHRANQAERAIQTYKNHFVAILASVDPDFPLAQWDLLLQQTNITINLLRSARCNPKLSAYAYLFGNFNFQATPLAPPGTRVIAFKTPQTRTSWAPHGEEGWYVGPALNHYRCVTIYFPASRTTRIVDTLRYFPKVINFPKTTLEDHLRQASSDIIAILTNPPSKVTPDLESGNEINNALLKLASIFKTADKIPALPQIQKQSNYSPLPRVTKDAPLPRVTQQKTTAAPLPRVSPTTSVLDKLQQKKWQRTQLPSKHYNLRSSSRPPSFRAQAARTLLAQHIFSMPSVNHIYDSAGRRLTVEKLINGPQAQVWNKSLSMELGRLAQGNQYNVSSTDTIEFIHQHQVPPKEKVTYAQCICDHRPLKPEPHRIRLVVGGDKLDCDVDAGAPSTNLVEFKILLNSVISESKQGAKFLSCDIKDFFLSSPMSKPKYMKLKYSIFPQDIIDQYKLSEKVAPDGYIYIKIKKGMYGLKEAAVLAYEQLKKFLNKYGYNHVPGTAGIWTHITKPTAFCLCVDDIALKYYNQADLHHFFTALGNHYKYHLDQNGTHYMGLTLDWNYDRGFVDVSMPGYIPKLLKRLQHEPPSRPEYSPHDHSPIVFPKKGERQFTPLSDDSPHLSPVETKKVQSIVGALLYYGRALDNTILPALNDIAMFQSCPTKYTMNKCKRLLDYVSTFPAVTLRYHHSDMHLHIDSDAAYLIAPKAKSRIAGFYYFKNSASSKPLRQPNHPILVECRCLRHVVSSAAEAETAAIFHNAQNALLLRRILRALGHPQPPTLIKTDNATANGFVHNNIVLRKSKTWDMRYYWLRDNETQKNIKVYWKRGVDENDPNLADYHTKHHTKIHHRGIRPLYVRDKK